MLTNKTVNMNATCKLTTGETVMTVSGYVNADGSWSVSRYIENPDLYSANKELMDVDEDEFTSALLSKVSQIGDEK